MRSTKTQSDHDKMVKTMADKFERDGMSVQADHIGHRNGQPSEIAGHIPDVLASNYQKKIILEAETPETISLDDTKKQMQAFSNVQGTEFHMIVPRGHTADLKQQAREWGISIDQVWHMDV